MRGLFGHGGGLALAAASLVAGAGYNVIIVQNDGPPPPRKPRPRRMVPARPKFHGFDARVNRWTGKPHEHKREIARRLRQAQS